jgi:hypothetical protein
MLAVKPLNNKEVFRFATPLALHISRQIGMHKPFMSGRLIVDCTSTRSPCGRREAVSLAGALARHVEAHCSQLNRANPPAAAT